ncbi:MAG: septal ring lytic transglycosylase RlpA family protein [Mailhella sp.]|nr:septal ring lytic transglycosylase RlpA family protein [Mailhella sp.]
MITTACILRAGLRAAAPALLLLSVLLAGCSLHGGGAGSTSISGPQAHRNYGTRGQKPYTIKGKTYYPLASAKGYDKPGTASWYGPGFHSGKTASGDRYDQEAMTAAHTVLPFGTRLQVRNLDNGRSAVVMVNDRGPFVSGRIIDLSKAAARQLGMIGSGTAKVRITAIDDGASSAAAAEPRRPPVTTAAAQKKAQPSAKPAPAAPAAVRAESSGRASAQPGALTLYYVQTDAFSSGPRADEQAARLRSRGFDCRVTDGKLRKVQAGPWFSRQEAENALRTLRPSYGKAAIVTE